MRLGILSDTHDRLDRARRAIESLCAEGADVLIHCGDLTGPEMVTVCAVLPCYFTFGNHDADRVPALRRAIAEAGGVCLEWGGEATFAGKRVAVVHGHMHTDVRRLLAAQPDYLLSGHSHIAGVRQQGPTRRINPGALDEAAVYSVALLNLDVDDVRFLTLPH
jgi:putative phosphoesterase